MKYIVTMLDGFTKWAEAIPVREISAVTVAQVVMDHWVSRYGIPEQIHSDQGAQFTGRIFSELMDLLDIKKTVKQFYSLYGPLFIACHIGVSLMSLGFFCTLVWLTVDLTQFLPATIVHKIGDKTAAMGESGGKFVLAYAVHKVILPLRLAGAILLTRTLSRLITKQRGLKATHLTQK